ncbi:MAG: DeoR/GlpR family DNA-binding transcription regulator [Christensenella sp.]
MNGELIKFRQNEIYEYIKKRNVSTIEGISEGLLMSQSTVRRDLRQLAAEQKIVMFHGGVSANVGDEPFTERKIKHSREKEAIGAYAARLVAAGEMIYIGGGSSAYAFADALSRRRDLEDVTVVSAAINIANCFAKTAGVRAIVTGGVLTALDESMTSQMTLLALAEFNFKKAFLGAQGITRERGYTLPNMGLAELKKTVIAHTEKLVLLCDHTKFGRIGAYNICPIERVDVVVSEAREGCAAQYAELKAAGVKLIFCDKQYKKRPQDD